MNEQSDDIRDLCWMDQDTLIAADYEGRQLMKYSIDRVTRTCTGQVVVDTGYKVWSVSCSEGGLVFATEYRKGVVMVRVHNVNTGHREVWNTNIITSQSTRVHVSLGAEYIVISAGRDSYVHNKDRVLLYNVTHDQVSAHFIQTYVTDAGMFWGTFYSEAKLLIMNLHTKDTKLSTEGIVRAWGVSGTRKGYVYVTGEKRPVVGVYSSNGTFLHHLNIGPIVEGGTFGYSGAVSLSTTEDLIAFDNVAVYRTQP